MAFYQVPTFIVDASQVDDGVRVVQEAQIVINAIGPSLMLRHARRASLCSPHVTLVYLAGGIAWYEILSIGLVPSFF